MPMQYTDELVLDSGKYWIGERRDGESMPQYRERCAQHLEVKYEDYMAAWEIRTGRPWNEMSKHEADELLTRAPSLIHNMGWLSRAFPRQSPSSP